jgi:ATP-binding cassette subfamily B (MDR/TAP) protein 1
MDKQKKQINKRLMAYSRPERLILFLGVLSALLNGVVMPFFGLVLGEMMDILARPKIYKIGDDGKILPDEWIWNPNFRSDSDLFSLLFLILAILSFLFNALQTYLMSVVAENLTLRVRNDLFNKILRMPLKWFDEPKNNPGTLSARLAVDANLINGLTSTTVGIAVMSLGAFIGGLIISFYFAWELTLVSLAVSPLLMYSGKVQAEFAQGFAASTDEAYKESGGLIMESVTNIRTVASFSNENLLLKVEMITNLILSLVSMEI